MHGVKTNKNVMTGPGGGPVEMQITNFPPEPKNLEEWEAWVKAAKEARENKDG